MKFIPLILAVLAIAGAGAWFYTKHAEKERARQAAIAARNEQRSHAILRVSVSTQDDSSDLSNYASWLQEELRYLLSRHGVDLTYPQGSKYQGDDGVAYALRIGIPAKTGETITAELIGPSGQTEERLDVGARPETRLETVKLIVNRVQNFLPRPGTTASMVPFIGSDDAQAYETFVTLTADRHELSAQSPTPHDAQAERNTLLVSTEALVKQNPRFARAWGLLALSYLQLGGKDTSSLLQLASNAANKALAIDSGLPEARTALGSAAYVRGQWLAAREDFTQALKADAASPSALAAAACLFVDVGQLDESIRFGQQAVAQDPANAAVRECLAYALIGAGGRNATIPPRDIEHDSAYFGLARAYAMAALLEDHADKAEAILMPALDAQQLPKQWLAAVLKAKQNPKAVPAAIRALTKAASDYSIDPLTEIIGGVVLNQPDFVFNQLTRLHADHELAPLRVLWLQQTQFLREHPGFKRVIETAGVTSYWNERGPPDYCNWEAEAAGCRAAGASAAGTH